MNRPEGEPTRTNISVSFNGRELVGESTSAIDGNFFDFRNDVAAVFDTPEGHLLVDFTRYAEEYSQTKGQTGAVVVEGEFLSSKGHSAKRRNSSTLRGKRVVHTGNKGTGTSIIDSQKDVTIELLAPTRELKPRKSYFI